MIRVLLADDHPMVLHGLEQLVSQEPDMEVVATAHDGADAIAKAQQTNPDVAVLDLHMPTLDGIEATREITQRTPDVRVVVLTSLAERDRILRVLDAGALGYLMKDAEADEILRGIRAAARGESPLSPRAAREVLLSRAAGRPADALTPRQRQVLSMVAAGLANKQIARRLGIAEKTVKSHLSQVFQQIGAIDRVEAATWARDHGIAPA
jgi:DNA-binding NarL/FixJ family response regulator